MDDSEFHRKQVRIMRNRARRLRTMAVAAAAEAAQCDLEADKLEGAMTLKPEPKNKFVGFDVGLDLLQKPK